MSVSAVIAVLFLSAIYFERGHACSCAPLNLTDIVCESAFVGVVQVTGGPSICQRSTLEHQLKHLYTVKTIEKLSPGCPDINALRTATQDSRCGRKFSIGRQYLVAGNPTPLGIMETGLCRLVIDWSNLPNSHRNHYRHYLTKVVTC